MQRIEIWRFATLFLTGLVIGMTCLLLWPQAEPAPETKDRSLDPSVVAQRQFNVLSSIESPDASPEELNTQGEILAKGDYYFAGGNCSLALDKYKSLGANSRDDSAVLLRKAACYEILSKLDLAEVTYRTSLSLASNQNHQLLAISGFGRVLIKQEKYDEAISILAEQLLRIDQYGAMQGGTRSQLYFEYAKAIEAKLVAESFSPKVRPVSKITTPDSQPADLLRPYSLAVVTSLNNPIDYMEMIDQPPPSAVEETEDSRKTRIIQRPSEAVSTITANVSVGLQPVSLLLNQITQMAQLELQVSEKAKSMIAGRSRLVEIQSTTLSSFYDQLLISFGLVWKQVDNVIYVVRVDELNDEKLFREFQFQSALRSFRRFEIDFPSNPFRKAATLSRARIAVLAEEFDRASNLFRELEQSDPVGEVRAKSYFNQAKLSLLLNRPNEAITLLYQAIDQTSESNVEASGYCMLSQLHISTKEIKESIRAGRRGIATAVTLEQRQSAALSLARAYLLDSDPFSANMTLFRNREMILDPEQRLTAAFLGAYARSIGGSDSENVEIARNRLLTALSMTEVEEFQTFADCYIASMAYESLGFRERAIAMLTLALSKSDIGVWQRQVFFELAMLQKKMALSNEAIVTFKLLTDQEDMWKNKALIQLADLYSETKQLDECIDACRTLWNSDLSEAEKISTLKLLGAAYQAKGQHYSAALCFAGMLPGEI